MRRRKFIALKKEVLESQWLTEDLLRDRQLLHVKKLLRHAYQTTRYYRELFDNMGLRVEDIQSLAGFSDLVPVLDRSIIADRFNDLISSKWSGKYEILQTSGSTGTPTRFVHPKPFPMQVAGWELGRQICGLKGNERTLALWGADLGDGRYHIFDRTQNRAYFSFYSMPPEGFEELLDFIVRWCPEFVYGYVSVLYVVAETLEKRGITALGAKVIRTHAERLYDFQREKIQKVFGGEVFQNYSSREFNDLGAECQAHNGVHLLSNLRLFELDPIEDKDGNTGEVLVTDFANYAMPFIRYRIGDVLSIDEQKCSCGRSLPRASVQGRSIDLVRLRDGTLCYSVLFEKMMDPELVHRFLVHQRSYDRIDVHIVPTASFTESYRDDLFRKIKDTTAVKDLRILLEEEIDPIIANKYRLVRSDVSAQMLKMDD